MKLRPSDQARHSGASLGEVIVGLALFAMLSLAVVGTLIQTANLDKKDTTLTETTFLLDSLLERRVSQAREYSEFDGLQSTPSGEYALLEPGRQDGLENKYIYRVDVEEQVSSLKKVVVTVYHRDPNLPLATPLASKGKNGRAVTAGTVVSEPSR